MHEIEFNSLKENLVVPAGGRLISFVKPSGSHSKVQLNQFRMCVMTELFTMIVIVLNLTLASTYADMFGRRLQAISVRRK
jgi:hypothetical protein